MKTALLLLIQLLSFASVVQASVLKAHQGGIEGTVTDAATGAILPGATIELEGFDTPRFTNELGYFAFTDLEKGTYALSVSYIGYAKKLMTEVAVSDNATTYVEIYLEPKGIELPEVEVLPDPQFAFQTISQIDIKSQPIQNAQEVLRAVPGLFIAQHAGGGKAEQIFLRGFDIDHGTDVVLSVDGMPVNMVSHAHGQGYSDLHFVIPELVDRVHFDKGPYNANTGNFATAGEVGFQTLNALENSFVKLEAGQFDSYRLVNGLNILNTRKHQLYTAVELNYTNGYFDSPQYFRRTNAMAKYNVRISPKEHLAVSFSTFNSQWDASGQIPVRAVESGQISRFGAIDDTEGGQTGRTNVNLIYRNNLSANTFIRQQLFYSSYDFELYSNFTFFARDPENGDQIRQHENRSIIGYNGSLQQRSSLLGLPLQSEVGLQLRFDDVKANELSYTRNRTETLERIAFGDVQEANVGLYYKGLWSLSNSFTVEAGLRFDQFYFNYLDGIEAAYAPEAVFSNIFSPKLKLAYEVLPNWQIYWNGGLGFHSNDTRVVVAQNGRETLPRAYGTDLGTVFKPFPSLLVHTAFWLLELDQEFVYVGDEGIVEPSGRTRRMGLDLSLRYQMTQWLYANADFSWARPRSLELTEGENYIPLAPTFTSTGGINIQFKNGLSGAVNYRYLADRAANEDNSITAGGYFLMDAMLQYKTSRFAFGLTARNLLNTEWNEAQFETESRLKNEPEAVSEIHFTPGQPRSLMGQLVVYF